MTSKRLPTLCVVAGPNGSGKTSTTIQLLANEWSEGSLYINPDNIAQEQFGDWNSPDAVMKAAKAASELRYKCLVEKKELALKDT
jgi:predicted ABC-type ATPase